jgi:RNA polymerase sigma-70 factor (ECF subfamily)
MTSSALPNVSARRPPDPPDEEAVDRRLVCLLSGKSETDALAAVYDRHAGAAYALADRICGAGAAEDAVEEAFLRLWREIKAGRLGGPLRARLLRLVRSSALKRLPDADRVERQARSGRSQIGRPLPGRIGAAAIDALNDLPAAARECIELAYFGGLDVGTIAACCEVDRAVVTARLSSGLHHMLGGPDRPRVPLSS